MKILDLRSQRRHLATLADWHQAEWAHLNPGETLEMRIQRMQSYLGSEFVPSMFVGLHGGELAGSSAVVECDLPTHAELTPWLASVFVTPAFRRRGLGAALVRHAMAETRRAGFDRMYLYTEDQEGLYQSLGWRTLAHETYLGGEIVVMEADLASVGPEAGPPSA